eukprot:TRINITY_DN8781_c0_g3_i1.p1 TRINITY_DN8781_c0_g3~~TRINITY_DN8781_c0_g3_i1.p1  ORF type:complete len:284 (+),score=38.81 TRINITY_DN8781_c0_g3_i1:77-928(+)
MLRLVLVAACFNGAVSLTVTITGATGQTGSAVYLALKEQNITVRGLVRSTTKAKAVLKCDKCDESEGIFVGDVTKPETLKAAMSGADSLVIGTGPAFHCTFPSIYVGCHFFPGADPKTMSWIAVKNQVSVFAGSEGTALSKRHVMLLSNDLTTVPDNFLDKIDNGQGCFWSLNGEVFTMGSGVPFTIIKPNGLNDGEAAQKEIVVGHDDMGWKPTDLNYEFIRRSDVVRLLTYAAMNRAKVIGLRFDVTSKYLFGTPTKDVSTVFEAARNPWNAGKPPNFVVV